MVEAVLAVAPPPEVPVVAPKPRPAQRLSLPHVALLQQGCAALQN